MRLKVVKHEDGLLALFSYGGRESPTVKKKKERKHTRV